MWALGIKNGEIYKSGMNLVIDGSFDEFIPVPEIYARQLEKLEYIGYGKYKVIDGETLLTLEELNAQNEKGIIEDYIPTEKEVTPLVEPINE